ncbi:MAG: hypothetical protein ACKPKO_64885, partial [Candidatus Fonsibacter sp.]
MLCRSFGIPLSNGLETKALAFFELLLCLFTLLLCGLGCRNRFYLCFGSASPPFVQDAEVLRNLAR